jgi:hypothetical protein
LFLIKLMIVIRILQEALGSQCELTLANRGSDFQCGTIYIALYHSFPRRQLGSVCTICRSWRCTTLALPSYMAVFPVAAVWCRELRPSPRTRLMVGRALFVPTCVCCLCTT